ncbi:unnamed protein product [Lactuca saligna]|uniref:Uncharacterized protein n=1 Tax=Lactuca saligna TaxID=75948 RepID=A0AA35ZJD2_LACSI|nr:unnamed protein product [Lactuca saligna]
MLKKIDPSNPILVAYLQKINPSVETGVLLLRSDEGSYKKSNKSKKEIEEIPSKESPKKILAKSPTKRPDNKEKVKKKVVKQIEVTKNGSSKEIIPSKSRVFKRLRKLSHKSKVSSDDHYSLVRKALLNRKGVLVRETPTPFSPSSKKRRAKDVAKHIADKRKKRKLVIHEESSDSEIVPETPLGSNSPIKTSTPITFVVIPSEVVISNSVTY